VLQNVVQSISPLTPAAGVSATQDNVVTLADRTVAYINLDEAVSG